MQRGDDRTGSEQTSGDDDQRTSPGPGSQEVDEQTRAVHDLAVANDAGEDPDPGLRDLPRSAHERG